MINETGEKNLEFIINNVAFEIVNEGILNKTEIDKILGVLVSDGFYAMWIYACNELKIDFKEDGEELKKTRLFRFLEKISIIDNFVMGKLEYDDLVREIAEKTRKIKKIEGEIKEVGAEIEKIKEAINNRSSSPGTAAEKEDLEKKKKEMEEKKKQMARERNYLLNAYFLNLSSNPDDSNLDDLLFFQGIWEKILVYARYHAKAAGDKK